RGHREAHRIGTKPRLTPEGRNHLSARIGHGDADHIVWQRLHGIVRRHAEMSAVTHTHHRYARLFSFANRQFHCPMTYHHADTTVAIYQRRGRRLADDFDVRLGFHGALAQPLDVPTMRVKPDDSMGVHTAQIGHDQGICRYLSVAFWHTEFFEGCDHESAQLPVINPCHCFSR